MTILDLDLEFFEGIAMEIPCEYPGHGGPYQPLDFPAKWIGALIYTEHACNSMDQRKEKFFCTPCKDFLQSYEGSFQCECGFTLPPKSSYVEYRPI